MDTTTRLDRKYVWHPFTQEATAPIPISIQQAKGIYLYDVQGNAYKDMISSWWVNLHGHAHPKLVKALHQQSATLDHVVFAGFTHEPAVALCERLSAILPDMLCKFFFSDNGSTSVEVALKIAYQYWYNKGEERSRFIALEGGYHGDTLGAMSVGANSVYHNVFRKLFFPVKFIPYPEFLYGENDLTIDEEEELVIKKLDAFLDKYGEETVALIIEPCIQGASGMRVCRPQFLNRIISRVRRYNIIVIFDEVLTGFGRTGPLFALEHLDEIPDIICLSKGITGGMLPLGLTVTTQTIYEAFLGTNTDSAFLHGHSYTANPITCAVATESFNLLTSKKCIEQRKIIEEVHKACIFDLYESRIGIYAPRVLGTIGAFRLGKAKKQQYQMPYGIECREKALQQGIIIRPIGNTVYFIPPYSITAEELYDAYDILQVIIQEMKIYEEKL